MRVFIIEKPPAHIDLAKAEEFGEIEIIFRPTDRHSSVFHADRFGHDVLTKLTELNFDSLNDAFALVGGLVPVSVAMSAIFMKYGTLKILFYNAPESRYVLRVVDASTWKGELDESIVRES